LDIASQGNKNIILCERGIRTYEKATRNTLDISAVPSVTSTITGKCVPCFKIGTADISRVLRVAFS
jgi:hypothetical protein